jgi:putative ABC transport system ATP-binding protein
MTSVDPAEPSRGLAVEAWGLRMIYPRGRTEVSALDGVSLSVPKGQFVCVMGPSGSGKSSLMHILAALQTPTEGGVRIGDHEVHALSDNAATVFRRRNIGLIFQFFNLVPTLNVERNIGLPLRADGISPATIRERLIPLADSLGIADRIDHYPAELSGGEMQRVAIARAVITEPTVILADEPTGNLDSTTGDEVLGRLREMCDRRGVTTILMTHDLNAVSYADRLITLRDGKVDRDTPASLIRDTVDG